MASIGVIQAPAAEGEPPRPLRALDNPPKPAAFNPPERVAPAIPEEEPDGVGTPNAGFATSSAFSAATPAISNATTLTPPVTLTYNGSANAFALTDGGTGRGLSASMTNAHNSRSALYGDTLGAGAGLTGANLGTVGPGGKFEVSNSHSAQAGAFASTNGTGSAILGTVTNTTSDTPAIYGQSTSSPIHGVGMAGFGNFIGAEGVVLDSSTGTYSIGTYGENDSNSISTSSFGVYGYAPFAVGSGGRSSLSYGVSAISDSNYALYAFTTAGNAVVYAESASTSASGYGVYAKIASGTAVEGLATSNGGTGVVGTSFNGTAVYALDLAGGTALFATSASGLAGEFHGNVNINGTLTVGSTVYTSDRNLKTDVGSIDRQDLLARVSSLPIASWTYKSDPSRRHVGPMAQDFHAAFGLNGDDEAHISEVDIAGVSLAAIQELSQQLKSKDAQIAELRAQLKAQADGEAEANAQLAQFAARLASLERKAGDRPHDGAVTDIGLRADKLESL
jgi:hypothetical protein